MTTLGHEGRETTVHFNECTVTDSTLAAHSAAVTARILDMKQVGYIVRLESHDGEKRHSYAARGRTRGECIRNAVDEMFTRDGIVYKAISTTSISALVKEIEAPSRVPERRIYVSPTPRPKKAQI